MAFTKKIAGWAAGRLKGEQARKDTMRWMEKTGLGQILGVGGDAALIGGALKGAGALKGLLTGGGASSAGATGAVQRVLDPSTGGFVNVGGTATGAGASAGSGSPSLMGQMLGGARDVAGKVGGFAKENAALLGPALTAGAEVLGQRGEQDVAMRRLDMEEQLRKEEQARRDRLAQLLMPMFQSQVQQYGQRPQG